MAARSAKHCGGVCRGDGYAGAGRENGGGPASGFRDRSWLSIRCHVHDREPPPAAVFFYSPDNSMRSFTSVGRHVCWGFRQSMPAHRSTGIAAADMIRHRRDREPRQWFVTEHVSTNTSGQGQSVALATCSQSRKPAIRAHLRSRTALMTAPANKFRRLSGRVMPTSCQRHDNRWKVRRNRFAAGSIVGADTSNLPMP